jgi:hypothetical protein
MLADLYAYRCERCGDNATWRPSKQQVMCRSCSTVVPLPAADQTPAASFFLLPYLRDDAPKAPIQPTGVVPFRIDEAEAHERLHNWWRDLRGSDPRTRNLEPDPLVARYVPYWQFSVRMHCSWRHTDEDSDGRRRVREGAIHGDYGEREPGNDSLPAALLRGLPFAFEHAVAYDRRYLAGAVVEQYSGDIFRAWDAARWRLDDLVKKLVRKDSGVFGGPEEHYPSFSNEKGWLILAPFYTTGIDVRGRRHQIIIDGHSGQIASSAPPFIPLFVWLLLAGMIAAAITLAWWAFSLA